MNRNSIKNLLYATLTIAFLSACASNGASPNSGAQTGAVVGALAVGLALFLFNRLEGVPRATLVLYPIFLVVFLGGPRLLYRVWKDKRLNLVAPKIESVS